MAAWDVAGIAAGMPLAELLGGRDGETIELYRSVAQASPQACAFALVPMSPTCTTKASSCALMRPISASSFLTSVSE